MEVLKMDFTLAHLPIDVFRLLLSGRQRSYLVIDLWKCGNALLNLKLASSIEYLCLRDTRMSSTSRYPKLVSNLRNLRYFSINRRDHPLMASSADLSLEIRKLSSLTTLKIRCFDCHHSLHNHTPESTYDSTNLIESLYERGESELIDMAAFFPKLTTLKLGRSADARDGYLKDFAGLPPHLTTLCIPLFNPTSETLLKLPRSLTHFKTKFAYLPRVDDWKLAPPGLTDIGKVNHHFDIARHMLPPSIQAHFLVPFPSIATPYPSHLQKLVFYCENVVGDTEIASWVKQLPRNLESLTLNARCPIPPSSLIDLPPTLTELDCSILSSYSIHFSSLEANQIDSSLLFWPSHLKAFSTLSFLSESNLKTLPKGITQLSFGFDSALPLDGSVLPNSLIELKIHGKQHLHLSSSLPSTITSFSFSSPIGLPLGFDAGSLSLLPPHLSSLRLDSLINVPSELSATHDDDYLSTSDWHAMMASISAAATGSTTAPSTLATDVVKLPRHLLSLNVSEWSWKWPLPPTLTELQVRSLQDFPRFIEELEEDPFSILPSGLKKLHFMKSDCIVLSDAAFRSLPHLRSLSVSATFKSSILRNLPRFMNDLYLRLSSLEEEDLPFLPPLLTSGYLNTFLPSSFADYWTEGVDHYTDQLSIQTQLTNRADAASARSWLYPDPRVVQRFANRLECPTFTQTQ